MRLQACLAIKQFLKEQMAQHSMMASTFHTTMAADDEGERYVCMCICMYVFHTTMAADDEGGRYVCMCICMYICMCFTQPWRQMMRGRGMYVFVYVCIYVCVSHDNGGR